MSSDRIVEMVGANGERLKLHCTFTDPYRLATSFGLHGLAPVALGSRQVANLPGERLETVRRLPRVVPLPVRVFATTEQELDDRLAALARILDATGDIRLIFIRPDGKARELSVRYQGGADPIALANTSPPYSVKIPLVFKAFDPDWRATTEDAFELTQAFNNGLTSGINPVTVDNTGDVETWPEWFITGPAENIEAVNITLGQSWRALDVLEAGDRLRIRTDPRQRGVWLNDDLAWRAMEPESIYWPLIPGINELAIRAIGNYATIGEFRLTFRERFDSC